MIPPRRTSNWLANISFTSASICLLFKIFCQDNKFFLLKSIPSFPTSVYPEISQNFCYWNAWSKSSFTSEAKWTHTGLKFQTGVKISSVHMKFHFGFISKRPNILMDMCRHFISGSVSLIFRVVFIGQNDRYEIRTVLSFILPQFVWIEVRFSTEMKSHTSLSSFCL